MAKQVINIGTTANDGTGDPLRTAFDKVNDNFTELYSDDAGDVGSIIGGTGLEVDSATGDVTVSISDDGVTYTQMGTEFTTAAVISASAVDFSSAAVFTKTLTAATTLTLSNVSTGMVKDLVITGDYTLTLPSSVKTITGTYDGTVSNLIQIVSTNGSTEQWATISQEA
tara:strand:+ start:247 stop:753 length:507 start_codon:yes stop_codon:yes gene_type:complete